MIVVGMLVAAACPQAAYCWSLPSMPSIPGSLPGIDTSQWQDQVLQGLWDSHKDSMGYCVGDSLADAKQLFRESFPSPLPLETGPDADPVCSNSSLVLAHLCTHEELDFYMKVRRQKRCSSPKS